MTKSWATSVTLQFPQSPKTVFIFLGQAVNVEAGAGAKGVIVTLTGHLDTHSAAVSLVPHPLSAYIRSIHAHTQWKYRLLAIYRIQIFSIKQYMIHLTLGYIQNMDLWHKAIHDSSVKHL